MAKPQFLSGDPAVDPDREAHGVVALALVIIAAVSALLIRSWWLVVIYGGLLAWQVGRYIVADRYAERKKRESG